jgi:SAM-dependent methyltransferase
MTYNPREYWQRKGQRYRGQNIKDELKALTKWVRKIQPASILDVGCGYGRIYRHLRQIGYSGPITLCDFVEIFRERCQKTVDVLPDWWDGHTLPYEDGAFEFVLSFSVLHHVLPEDLEQVFAEHVRVTSKWLYVSVGLPKKSEGPNILHDYQPLIEEHNLTIVRNRWFGKRRKQNWLLRKL